MVQWPYWISYSFSCYISKEWDQRHRVTSKKMEFPPRNPAAGHWVERELVQPVPRLGTQVISARKVFLTTRKTLLSLMTVQHLVNDVAQHICNETTVADRQWFIQNGNTNPDLRTPVASAHSVSRETSGVLNHFPKASILALTVSQSEELQYTVARFPYPTCLLKSCPCSTHRIRAPLFCF